MQHLWTDNFKQTLRTMKRSAVPAFLFAAALVLFFAQNPFAFELSNILHYTALAICCLCLIFLILINQAKPSFSLGLGLICYLSINWLKHKTGAEFASNGQFLWLCFLMPFNFGLFYLLPAHKLLTKRSLYIIITVLLELAFVQYAENLITTMPYIDICWQTMPLAAAFLWCIMLISLLLAVSLNESYLNTGIFYACSCIFLSFIYADTASGLSAFFLGFVLILSACSLLDFYHRYYYDEIDNIGSFATFLAHSGKKFTFKYSIGLFSINNRDKWCQELGRKKVLLLEKMVIQKIQEMSEDYEIYRYNHEEFIIVFNNQNTKQASSNAENIKRAIAAAEFIFSSGENAKITISIAISEKTRKYMEGAIVAERAHEYLQKSLKFHSNIITIVPN